MQSSTVIILLLDALLAVEALAAESWTECPAATSRQRLFSNKFTVTESTKGVIKTAKFGDGAALTEGRRLLIDADSYPRKPGKLVGGPTLAKTGEGYVISFALDRPDDVAVRVIDGEGKILRNLACGVLGPNTPEPLQKNSLTQKIIWDGKPQGRIEVAVGLSPKIESFVGYDRGQLSPYLSGLSVDGKGRVYVSLFTAHRYDPSIIRLDREGRYIDMVYPSNPAHLKALGKRWEDVYDLVEHIDGESMPIKPSSWRYWIAFWDDYYKFPFKIGPDDKGYICVGMPNEAAMPASQQFGDIERLDVIQDIDHFWFWPGKSHPNPYGIMWISHYDAGFAFDGKGHVLVASLPYDKRHHSDRVAMRGDYSGTIRSVDMKTGKMAPIFEYHGAQKLDEPSPFLCPANPVKGSNVKVFLETQKRLFRDGLDVTIDAKYDAAGRFCEIEDLTVDDAGNILVIDGYPRRLKCHASNGRWLGDLKGLAVAGRQRQFHDFVNITWANGAYYLLTSFRDDRDGPVYLLKCTGEPTDMRVIWSVPLDGRARFVAVDSAAQPALVWVGNGNGLATVSRIEDRGTSAGDVRHVGGIVDTALIDPATFTCDSCGNLYVWDKAREAVVKLNPEGRIVARFDFPKNQWADFLSRRRRHSLWNEATAFADGTRYFFRWPLSMVVDEQRGLLWMNFNDVGGKNAAGDGERPGPLIAPFDAMIACDLDLKEIKARIGRLAAENGKTKSFSVPGVLGGIDAEGNVFLDSGKGIGKVLTSSQRLGATLVGLNGGGESMAIDSQGNFYAIDGPSLPSSKDGWGARLGYTFPSVDMRFWGFGTRVGTEALSRGDSLSSHTYVFQPRGPYHPKDSSTFVVERGDHVVLHKSEVAYLVKFGPDGGSRNGAKEQWTLRGGYYGKMCVGCDWPRGLLACDGADRLHVADVDHYAVRTVDSAGNLICRTGRYGNAETESAFRNIYGMAAKGERLYVCDRDLRRIAKFRFDYREQKTADLSP